MRITAISSALLACLVSGAALAQVASSNPEARPQRVPAPLPPYEIATVVRSTGLSPIGAPVRVGPTYEARALDRYGRPVRVLVDAYFGSVLGVRPFAGGDGAAMQPYGTYRAPTGYPTATQSRSAAPPAAALRPATPRAKPAETPAVAKVDHKPAIEPLTTGSTGSTSPAEAKPAPSVENAPAPPALPPVAPLE